MAYYVKDPDAKLDYGFDWTAELAEHGDDSITSATVVASPAGLTVSDVQHADGKLVTYWLEGGDAGVEYEVRCRVVTAAGRIDDRTDRVGVQHT